MFLFSLFFFIGFLINYHVNSFVIDLSQTIGYYINTTRGNLDLTIVNRLLSPNCSQSFLTLIDLISFCLSIVPNPIVQMEKITTLRLINLCPIIEINSLEKLQNIRRLIFDNCTIDFLVSSQHDDYHFYPRNLTRWIFNQGHTNTFKQFIMMINYLGPLKFDLQFTDCFQPIFSFNDFYPLNTQLISLYLICNHFRIDQPLDMKIRSAIFLTPTLFINTQSQLCPSINQYQWLNLRYIQKMIFSLRILICENRSIELYWNSDSTTATTTESMTTIIILTTNQSMEISFSSSTILTNSKWTTSILINFSMIFFSILMLFAAVLIRLILRNNKSTI